MQNSKKTNDYLLIRLHDLEAQKANLLHTHQCGGFNIFAERDEQIKARQIERLDEQIARLEREISWPIKVRIS